MKPKTTILFLLLILVSHVYSQKKSNNEGVFDLNSLLADQNYYTKAVLEYRLVKEVINSYSSITQLIPNEDPGLFLDPKYTNTATKNDFLMKNGKPTVTIFPQLASYFSEYDSNSKANTDTTWGQLEKLGIESCRYVLPKGPNELDSGFQFNHYFFRGTNKAAMQAFGMVDGDYNQTSMYIVTDYIQYKDCNCTGIPTIRYAIGLRSEFKISQVDASINVSKISSLAGLAAYAETDKMSVNITVKTIGITGLKSKVNIPNNTSFDVSTYDDYQDVIKFIKNFPSKPTDSLRIHPEIIPVMDEYRTTLSHSFEPMYSKMEKLQSELKKLEKEHKSIKRNKDESLLRATKERIFEIKLNSIKDEIESIELERKLLKKVDIYMNNYDRYLQILNILKS